MKLTGVGTAALLGSFLLTGALVAAPANLAHLDVSVVDEAGTPVSGALVFVETSLGETLLAVSDGDGQAGVDLATRGHQPLEVQVGVLGEGPTEDLTLERGDSGSETIVLPVATSGHEWIWVGE